MINSIRLICKVPQSGGILGPILGPSFAKTMDEIFKKGQDEDSTQELNRGSK
jgi:hypothetical protein